MAQPAKPQTAKFSLSDQLFNESSIGDLAKEYSVLPGFDADPFLSEVLSGFPERGLLERLDWIADCVEARLPSGFPEMAEALHAAMPPKLDPSKRDDDFGRFIHAVPGILAVRHGLETHREAALDLLYLATQRFSMEFYIRPFLNRWPEETLARLDLWVQDENYHVRRLVSEGTRPKLPWATNVKIDPMVPARFLDQLHADPTRYVTRSVANHMNDLSKIAPDHVVAQLQEWQNADRQSEKELAWMSRHALRTAIKRGEPGAMNFLGYRSDAPVLASINLKTPQVKIGETLEFDVSVTAEEACNLMVDYRIIFARPDGKQGEKVFKLKACKGDVGKPVTVSKKHRLKGDATTFRLYPGLHGLVVQINGVDRAKTQFDLINT